MSSAFVYKEVSIILEDYSVFCFPYGQAFILQIMKDVHTAGLLPYDRLLTFSEQINKESKKLLTYVEVSISETFECTYFSVWKPAFLSIYFRSVPLNLLWLVTPFWHRKFLGTLRWLWLQLWIKMLQVRYFYMLLIKTVCEHPRPSSLCHDDQPPRYNALWSALPQTNILLLQISVHHVK